jgi:hypothetical protein
MNQPAYSARYKFDLRVPMLELWQAVLWFARRSRNCRVEETSVVQDHHS